MNVPRDGENEESAAELSNTPVVEIDHEKISLPNHIPSTNGIHPSRIVKHIATFDKKYVLHCLDLLRNYAVRSSAPNFPSKVQIVPDDWSNMDRNKFIAPLDMDKPTQSIINILYSPLLKQLGPTDFDANFDHEFANPPGPKRAMSMSSTTTSFSDNSSTSASATSFQGMMECKRKDGLPYFIFSVDDRAEVYAASLSKIEPSVDKGFNYVYTFCSRMRGEKESGGQELEPRCLGTMKVSTSITLCPKTSSEVKETRFVLSISGEDCYNIDERQISNHYGKSGRRWARKVAKVFKSRHSYKRIPDYPDSTWGPCESSSNRSENGCAHNLEVAAILVKDTSFKNQCSKEDGIGGWGLKFLKKSAKETILPVERMGNYGQFSTSLDVLVPAGIHGRSKMGGGEASSLVERWVSGGACDCGGWDLGCPLTVLSVAAGGANSSPLVDASGSCESVDLFIQGSKQDAPTFKMASIHEGLYYIHFQSTLSTLQSFAIATSIIHQRSLAPRSKVNGL